MSAYPQHELAELLDCADTGTWGDEGVKGSDNPVLRSSNIQDSKLDLTEYAWRRIPQKHIEKKTLVDGDIIVTMSSGSPALIGKCCIFRQPPDTHTYLFSNFTLRLRPNGTLLDSKWLHYWLSSPRGRTVLEAMNNTTSGLRNLNRKLYHAQKIPLPPLEEQKRIAAILDKADAVRRKRQESIRLTEEFLKSVFLDMFGDPVTNPNKWNVKPLADITNFKGGGTPSKKIPNYFNGQIPWVTPKDMKSVEISDSMIRITSQAVKHSAAKVIPSNSVLVVVRSGVLKHTFPIAVNTREVTINQDMKALICTEYVYPYYLMFCLKAYEQCILSKTRATTADNIPMDVLKVIPIPLPNKDRMKDFENIYLVQSKLTKGQLRNEVTTHNLYNSLVQRAFKGEL